MITLEGSKYQLFFSNDFAPLIALNYADELFFDEFENLLGKKYRILSIIKKGWQQKYGKNADIEEIKNQFELMIKDPARSDSLLDLYDKRVIQVKNIVEKMRIKNYFDVDTHDLITDLKNLRKKGALLDAMTNMFHLFGSLIGCTFSDRLKKYSDDKKSVNENLMFYTQPIKESKYAKINHYSIKNQFELTKEDKIISKLLRIGAYVSDDVSSLLQIRKEVTRGLFIEISKRIGCSADDINYLQISEIEYFLISKQNATSLIEKRRDITILFYAEEKLIVIEGEKAKEFLQNKDYQEFSVSERKKFLTGQTASLGKARGKVVVALNSTDALKNMHDGFVLVAPYTGVEYVPVMKKACAIVTEVGGITSHAAIVSREFGIPCIVSVKDVTKILHTGDLVEVDADNNTIKVIE